eukprot:6487398-Amphidinium_carterae.1
MELDPSERGRDMVVGARPLQNQHEKIPDKVFDSSGSNAGSVECLTRGTATWHSPGPWAHSRQCLLWMSILELRGSFDLLSRCWLSLLAVPGTMMRNVHSNVGGIVVHRCDYGILIWKVALRGTGKDAEWDWRHEADERGWFYAVVKDENDWQCMECSVVLPERSTKSLPGMPSHKYIGLRKKGRRKSMMQLAAERCFPGWTRAQLNGLYNYLQVPHKPRPQNVTDLMSKLVKHILPDITDKEVEEKVDARVTEVDLEKSFVESLEGDEPEQDDDMPFEGLIDEEDIAILRKVMRARSEIKKRHDAVQTSVSTTDQPAKCEPTSAASGSALGRSRLPLHPLKPEDTCYDLEALRRLIPDVPEVRLYRELTYHTRFRCVYEGADPRTKSKSWNETFQEKDAAHYIIEWLWARHKDLHRGECPYDLETLFGKNRGQQ